jgi:hypothetical protein
MTKETRYMTGATATPDCCNRLLQQLQKTRYMSKETYYTHVKQEKGFDRPKRSQCFPKGDAPNSYLSTRKI